LEPPTGTKDRFLVPVVAPNRTKEPFHPLAIRIGTNIHISSGSNINGDKCKESKPETIIVDITCPVSVSW
jgi:hypothetical protein